MAVLFRGFYKKSYSSSSTTAKSATEMEVKKDTMEGVNRSNPNPVAKYYAMNEVSMRNGAS